MNFVITNRQNFIKLCVGVVCYWFSIVTLYLYTFTSLQNAFFPITISLLIHLKIYRVLHKKYPCIKEIKTKVIVKKYIEEDNGKLVDLKEWKEQKANDENIKKADDVTSNTNPTLFKRTKGR